MFSNLCTVNMRISEPNGPPVKKKERLTRVWFEIRKCVGDKRFVCFFLHSLKNEPGMAHSFMFEPLKCIYNIVAEATDRGRIDDILHSIIFVEKINKDLCLAFKNFEDAQRPSPEIAGQSFWRFVLPRAIWVMYLSRIFDQQLKRKLINKVDWDCLNKRHLN